MTRPSNIHPAIPAFTAGFRPRPMDKKSIRMWIAKKTKVRRPSSLRRRLVVEIVRAETALIDLKPIKTHPNVGLLLQTMRPGSESSSHSGWHERHLILTTATLWRTGWRLSVKAPTSNARWSA